MASTSQSEFESQKVLGDNTEDLYGIRDGVLFVIDSTPAMFEIDPQEQIPYFLQCIRRYKEILMQKLVWNNQDWMGLILFGTTKGDENSEMKNILTLQKLNLVSIGALKQIVEIDEGNGWKRYRDSASTTAYPLHDVLWHASRIYCAVRVTMPARRVILFTCTDNPPLTNDDEKRRIVVEAKSYGDIGLHLHVVGLGENWDHNVFYRDLEILSEKIDSEDYKRPSINDLLQQIKLPSRTMAKLPWRIGGNVVLDVNVTNLNVKRQYLKKTWISKETNVPLIARRFRMTEESDDEDGEPKKLNYVLDTDLRKYKVFGGKKIYFTIPEKMYLGNFYQSGIDLICLKPIFYHPLYHCRSPYLVTPGKSNRKDNTLLFAALLEKCNSRNLMAICAVTMRKHSSPILYSMIPKAESGGFYLYKIPYKERIRNLEKMCSKYMYNDDENKIPTEPEEVQLLRKIIRKLRAQYNPSLIPNPKLQTQLQMVETLALDLEESKPPIDETMPIINQVAYRIKDLTIQFKELFKIEEGPPKKKPKTDVDPNAYDEESIRKFVKTKKLSNFTVPELKAMSKKLGLKTSGKKGDLIEGIKSKIKSKEY
nr:X-ray repair cross-complementing protein 6 [Megalopta genalis]